MLRRLVIAGVALTMVFGSAQATVGAKVTGMICRCSTFLRIRRRRMRGYLNSGETCGRDGGPRRLGEDHARRQDRLYGGDFLTPVSSSSSSSDNEYATRVSGYATRSVTVYERPSTSSRQVISLPWGTEVFVTGTNGSFCRVENASGTVRGYIPGAYLSRTQRPTPWATPRRRRRCIPSPPLLPAGSGTYPAARRCASSA